MSLSGRQADDDSAASFTSQRPNRSRDENYLFFRDPDDLRRGTFAPFLRASLSPMAMACFRLFTFRPDPLFSVPFFLRCIADLTRLPAALPYLAMPPAMQMPC